MTAVLNVLAGVQARLARLLCGLEAGQWELPTPAEGWSVRDQVAHLADTEEVAHATLTGGRRTFADAVSGFPDGEAFTESGCARGRGLSPGALLAWWSVAAARTRKAFAEADSESRVPWGLGMGVEDFARARIMEHWAHGLDIRAALGLPDDDREALPPVAALALASVPYALARSGVRRPRDRSLRLRLHDGRRLRHFGPPDATDVVTGPLDGWCRVAVRRPRPGDRTGLRARGPLAELAVAHVRAYL
ncbi:maleylpyruvate isomerase family mycothiol-dependent enzyme [Actinocorallia sp. B10E7]|uniref:maleylpyruvate isomerase family mycothiol-dependent enzyme n=1 Tax=Actinocorallia sp. B10E7 TaxID=3153558 RepID=UPI00325EA73A